MRGFQRTFQKTIAWSACAAAVAAVPACSAPESDPLPPGRPGSDIVLKAETVLVQGTVPRNATLDALLRAQNLTTDIATGVIDAVRTVFDPRKLRESQPFEILRTIDGGIRRFGYEIDAATRVVVEANPSAGTFRASLLPIPRERHEDKIRLTVPLRS